MRYKKASDITLELEVFKNELKGLLEELKGRLERTHHHIYEREERVSANSADQSQELENQELVLNLDVEGKAELKLVEEALARISKGTFGICQQCGKEVREERLGAIPHTKYCIECAMKESDDHA